MLRWKAVQIVSFVVGVLVSIQSAWAAESLHLEPFPLATEISRSEGADPDYRLMLGGIIKINGLIRSDREQRLNAKLLRTTWELPSGHSPEAGFGHVREQLLEQNATILFECAGRQCGASSLWANEVFKQSRLYGVDNSQFYAAFEFQQGHAALYAVRRGNGRVYLHLDLLSNDSQTASGLESLIRQRGYAELSQWPDSRDIAVQALQSLLVAFPNRKLVLVIHWRSRDLDLSLRQSQEAADRLKRTLVEKGINSERIDARGVGALVPSVLGSRSSVAVVLMQEE